MATITQLEWQQFTEKRPPHDELVLVYANFYGIHLRTFDEDGDSFDENEILDDFGIQWHLWCAIPPVPE